MRAFNRERPRRRRRAGPASGRTAARLRPRSRAARCRCGRSPSRARGRRARRRSRGVLEVETAGDVNRAVGRGLATSRSRSASPARRRHRGTDERRSSSRPARSVVGLATRIVPAARAPPGVTVTTPSSSVKRPRTVASRYAMSRTSKSDGRVDRVDLPRAERRRDGGGGGLGGRHARHRPTHLALAPRGRPCPRLQDSGQGRRGRESAGSESGETASDEPAARAGRSWTVGPAHGEAAELEDAEAEAQVQERMDGGEDHWWRLTSEPTRRLWPRSFEQTGDRCLPWGRECCRRQQSDLLTVGRRSGGPHEARTSARHRATLVLPVPRRPSNLLQICIHRAFAGTSRG